MDLYFDAIPLLGDARDAFRGQWSERQWLNVPGPFYGAETDNCGTGRIHAPGLVLYEADYFTEYVYRQPRTPGELRQLVDAAQDEVFGGYGCDGDSHWTPTGVREWWRERRRVSEYLAARRADWEADDAKFGQGVAAAALEYAACIEGELASHLRVYLFWLEERRSPATTDRLPVL
ncbi:hypothetical protein [Streptomyces sp. NRRL F-5123]|uniref:hypothetical protein n=1 Tax=Streptomyces sp. NRRL F-5123 TaxID=1463856 RepID=UPI0004E0BED3|nr:hypothetical protein [Streptomyces sp. NRRL F-5123]